MAGVIAHTPAILCKGPVYVQLGRPFWRDAGSMPRTAFAVAVWLRECGIVPWPWLAPYKPKASAYMLHVTSYYQPLEVSVQREDKDK